MELKNKFVMKLPRIPANATSEAAADGGWIYRFRINIVDILELHTVYISKDQSRVIEEISVIEKAKELKRYRTETLNGLKDGLQELYDHEGFLKERIEYKAGEKDGLFEGYSTSTKKLTERGRYKNGKKEGKWEYFSCQKYLTEIFYSNGKYDGSFKEFTIRKGKRELALRKYYVNGELSGISEKFSGANTYKISYLNGKKDGIYIEYIWGKPDVVGEYSNGKKTGEWTFYLIGTGLVLRIEHYKNGKKDGICKECYYRNSEKTGLEIDYVVETNYTDGLQEGEFPYEEFDQNGSLILKGSIINGKKEGVWEHYKNNELTAQDFYSNGELISTIQSIVPAVCTSQEVNIPSGPREEKIENRESYTCKYELINGVKNGLYQDFDCNGHLRMEGYYSNGEKVGIWKFYNEEGFLSSETPFDKGLISGIVKGYLEGELVDRVFVPQDKDVKFCPYERYYRGEIVEQGECLVDRIYGASSSGKKVLYKFRNGKEEKE